MIQRIQSIFLLLSGLSFFIHFLVPMAISSKPVNGFLADQLYTVDDQIGMLILTILGGALAIINIFLFKNRGLQMRLSYIVIILAILVPALAMLLFFQAGNNLSASLGVEDGMGLYVPILTIILTALAIRFIKKDDNLVRDSDRLR